MKFLIILLISFLAITAFAESGGYIKLTFPYPGKDTIIKETMVYVVDEHRILSIFTESRLRDGEYIDRAGKSHKVKAIYEMTTRQGDPYAKIYSVKDKLEIEKHLPERIGFMWKEHLSRLNNE